MAYQPFDPMDPRDAFTVTPDPALESARSVAASQAALILSARAGVLGVGDEFDEDAEEARDAGFEIPDLRPLQRSRRLRVDEATEPLGMSAKELEEQPAPQLRDEMIRTVNGLYERPTTEGAAALFEAAMHSPHPLVQVAAAAGARETTRLRKRIRHILEAGSQSDDRLVASLATEALSKIDPKDPHVNQRVIAQPTAKKRNRRSQTAVITHGTFSSDSAWYQPGGDFYEALALNRPDLAVHDESFTWTGAYSPAARRADALLLKQWIEHQGLDAPDFFAHSHGGTVATLATRQGVDFDRLVLMAWPVHQQWFPAFPRVNRIVDIRVRLDLVILLDRGGQRFRTGAFAVEEHRHGWFDHIAPHQPDYWDDHDLWSVV